MNVLTMCMEDGCEAQAKSLGWCRKHYTRWQRHGSPSITNQTQGNDVKRFMEKVAFGPPSADWPEVSECWTWTGYRDKAGYGKFGVGAKKVMLAHRWAYEHWIGPIPEGMHLDHFLCETPSCVNPTHVRPVTPRENVLRSEAPTAINLAKTHCPEGHEYSAENTYFYANGHRRCRKCHSRQQSERNRRLRAEKVKGGS